MKKFVRRDATLKKKRIYGMLIVGALVLAFIVIALFLPSEMITVTQITPIMFFIISTIGGLFFIPIPLEVLYTANIGSNYVVMIFAIIAGLAVGMSISYFIGVWLSTTLGSLISAKKLYGVRRKTTKYGAYTVFLVNLIPVLPAPVLAFALGIIRYSYSRFLVLSLLGQLTKYAIYTAFLLYTTNII